MPPRSHRHWLDRCFQHHLVGICHWIVHQLSDRHLHGIGQAPEGREIPTLTIQSWDMGHSRQHHRHLLPHRGLPLPVLPCSAQTKPGFHELGRLSVSPQVHFQVQRAMLTHHDRYGVVVIFAFVYYFAVGRHHYDGPVSYVRKEYDER